MNFEVSKVTQKAGHYDTVFKGKNRDNLKVHQRERKLEIISSPLIGNHGAPFLQHSMQCSRRKGIHIYITFQNNSWERGICRATWNYICNIPVYKYLDESVEGTTPNFIWESVMERLGVALGEEMLWLLTLFLEYLICLQWKYFHFARVRALMNTLKFKIGMKLWVTGRLSRDYRMLDWDGKGAMGQ